MTRPHVRRTAGAALTLGTAAAALLLGAPATWPPDLPTPTVWANPIIPNVKFMISGTGCVEPRLGEPGIEPAFVIIQGDAGLEVGTGGEVQADGTWEIPEIAGAGSTNGAHQIHVTCDLYDGAIAYPPINVTIGTASITATPTPTATPAPAPKPLATGNRATLDKITNGTPFSLGEKFTASYPGFKPFEVVTLVLHSTPQNVGTFTANASIVTVSFTIPAGTAAGRPLADHVGQPGTSFAQALKVSSSQSLAYTGADVAAPLAIGASLLVVGAGLTVVARRRKAGAQQA